MTKSIRKISIIVMIALLSVLLLVMNGAPSRTSARDSRESSLSYTVHAPLDLTPMVYLPAVINDSGVWSLFGNSNTNPAIHFLGTTDRQPIVFRTNNSEHVRIDANGNLGIGTTNPSAKAEVVVSNEGDLALRLESGTNAFLDIKPTTTGSRFQTVLDTVNSRDIVLLPHSNNVGIGQTAPTAKLDIVVPNEGDAALRLESGTNAFLDVKPTTTGGRYQTVLDTVNSRDIVLQPHNGNVAIASGNITQTLAGNGTVKTGVYAFCDNANSTIVRQFNNVNNVTLTISNGVGNGQCTIDFKFDVSSRFINVTAFESTVSARAVAVTSQSGNTATFLRFNGGTGTGAGGYIEVLVY